MAYEKKECEICGKEFQPVNSFHRFCSDECFNKHRKEYMKKYKEKNKEKLERYQREYNLKNQDRITERKRKYWKNYWETNKDDLKTYYKEYRNRKRQESINKMFEVYYDSLN